MEGGRANARLIYIISRIRVDRPARELVTRRTWTTDSAETSARVFPTFNLESRCTTDL